MEIVNKHITKIKETIDTITTQSLIKIKKLNNEIEKFEYAKSLNIEMTDEEHKIYIYCVQFDSSSYYREYTGIIPKIILDNILCYDSTQQLFEIHNNKTITDYRILYSEKLFENIINIIKNSTYCKTADGDDIKHPVTLIYI